jgi:hypothetical protein
MPDSDLLPEIIIDDSADGYVETDDEMEEEEPPEKSRPPASEIFHSQSQQDEPVLEVEVEEELPEERQPEPAPELSVEPIAKPKRQASAKQREHLARIRVKAAESRRQKTAQRQQRPATARSTPHPTFSEGDVDRLLDRYKERRRAKKVAAPPAVTKPERNVDLLSVPAAASFTQAVPDDPWAECFL